MKMNFLLFFGTVIGLLFGTVLFSYVNPKKYKYIENKCNTSYSMDETLKNRFLIKKIPKNIDVVIIGSGMSSLTLGCILSRTGKKVLILEKHYIAGGCLHTFTEKGIEFDVGLHYIGSIKEFKEVIDLLGDHDINLDWNQIGKDNSGLYDKITINNQVEGIETIDLTNNVNEHINEICYYYPHRKIAITKYFETIKYANKCGRFLVLFKLLPVPVAKIFDIIISFLKFPSDIFKCLYFARNTTKDVINDIIPEAEESLIDLLTGQYGDIGVKADKSSFIYHAGLISHYLSGGYYPVGGSAMLAHKMISCIKKFGGEVLVNAPVESIAVTKDDVANKFITHGVIVKNYLVKSNIVVSSIGVMNTVEKLLHKLHTYKEVEEFNNKLNIFKPSISHINLFIGLNGEPDELDLPDSNHWILNTEQNEYDDNHDESNEIPVMFVSFPSARNPDWLKNEKHKGKSNCIVITESNYNDFHKYSDEKSGNRNKKYKELKETISKKMLKQFIKYYPDLENKIDFYITGTPVTNEYYLNSREGCSYGLEHDVNRASNYDILRPKTFVNGLYFTGQDITSAGVAGAMFSGIVTSHAILDYGLGDMIFDRNIIKDLQEIY